MDEATTPTRLFSFWSSQEEEPLIAQFITVQENGRPYVRSMNYKYNLDNNTFEFITHGMSAKVTDLRFNDKVALHFLFSQNSRQVVVSGDAHVNSPEENELIWKTRSDERKRLSWKIFTNIDRNSDQDHEIQLPIIPYFCGIVVKPVTFDFSEKRKEGRRKSVHMTQDTARERCWFVKRKHVLINL